MCDEIKIDCCKRTDPPWESPQAWLVCNIKNNISLSYAQSKAEGI